jgi:hypothetical protein
MLPIRSIWLSKSNPWNSPWWKCRCALGSRIGYPGAGGLCAASLPAWPAICPRTAGRGRRPHLRRPDHGRPPGHPGRGQGGEGVLQLGGADRRGRDSRREVRASPEPDAGVRRPVPQLPAVRRGRSVRCGGRVGTGAGGAVTAAARGRVTGTGTAPWSRRSLSPKQSSGVVVTATGYTHGDVRLTRPRAAAEIRERPVGRPEGDQGPRGRSARVW